MLAALETTTHISSVALLDLVTGEEIAECSLPAGWESSATLVPALETLLQQKGFDPRDLDAVAVSIGPGSFTGIRVGMATAQGLCLPSNLLAYGINTLDGLAENLRHSEMLGEALCLLDAQRNECFTGHYLIEPESFRHLSPSGIMGVDMMSTLLRERAWIIGPGALKFEKDIRECLGTSAMFAFTALHQPKAMSIARVAYRRWKAGSRTTVDQMEPLYLRPPAVDEKPG